MRRLKLSILFFLMLYSASARAVTPAELANQAQSNYQAGRYEEAIRFWNELREIGFHNGDLYYNIGSAYWRLGKVGQARRFFLTARDWSPRDPDIRNNLAFIESKVDKTPAKEGPRALLAKLPFYRLSLNTSEALVLAALSSLALFTLLIGYRLSKKPVYAAVAAIFLFPLLVGLFQFVIHGVAKPAVVLTPISPLREHPLPDAQSREDLREGSLVRIRKSQGDFALVKTASGKEGWMERSSLGEIP